MQKTSGESAMIYLTQNNGRTVECNGWEEVKRNLTVYVSPNEFLQAESMMRAGCDTWNFVYGFCVDQVSKHKPTNWRTS